MALLIIGTGLALGLLMPARWRWLAGLGAAGAVALYIRSIAGGCREDFEASCDEQPVVFGFLALMVLAVWLFSVGVGVLTRRYFAKPS